MKAINILFVLIFSMSYNIQFETFLGKPLTLIEKTIGHNLITKKFGDELFYSSIEKKLIGQGEFNSMPIRQITVISNDQNIVQSISIYFTEVIEEGFLNAFIQNYGYPSDILSMDKKTVVSESIHEGGELRKSEGNLITSTFQDKPLFIVWKKDQYQIKALLKHDQGTSMVTFSMK